MHPPRPPAMSTEQALGVLGVTPPILADAKNFDEAQITLTAWKTGELKGAYRDRCKARHPDLGPEEEMVQRETDMKEINIAYEVLKSTQVQDNRRRNLHPMQAVMEAMFGGMHVGGQVEIFVNGGRVVVVQSVSTGTPNPTKTGGD